MANALTETGLRWLWIAVIFIIADQASKIAIINNMQLYQSISLMPSLNFTYVHNYGAAFSFLSDQGGWQRWFFTGIALAMSVLLVWWMYKTPRKDSLVAIAFALILSGAIGNVYDRMAYGYVIDFIHVFYGNWNFPAFNIADSAITVGAGLMIWDALFARKEEEASE